MNCTTILINEKQLKALNELVSASILLTDDCDTQTTVLANDWLVGARQALVASQEQEQAEVGEMYDVAIKAAKGAYENAIAAGWSQQRADRLEDSVFHQEMGELMFGNGAY